MDDIKIDAANEHNEHDGHNHTHAAKARKPVRFGKLLLKWASERRPKAGKPRKTMNADELKIWKNERNRRRRKKAKATRIAKRMTKSLRRKSPAPNRCRRRRLIARRSERK